MGGITRAESPRERFYRAVAEAITDFELHGFDSQERLDRWMREIAAAAKAAQVPEREVLERLTGQLERSYRSALSVPRLARVHPGVGKWTIERIKPELRGELRRRILASASLIKLDREASIQRTLSRFAGWASAVPVDGAESPDRAAKAKEIRRGIAGLPFVERRVIIDQSHKLAAAIDDLIARDAGAIAVMWRHVRPQPGYTPRPEHVARDGRVYLLRDSWARTDGLVKPGRWGYFEDVDGQPGQEIFCRCWGQFVYTLDRLPADMLTAKGRALLKRGEKLTASA